MSPRNPVDPLSFLSLKVVSDIITFALSDDEGVNYESVTKYLEDCTSHILQDLLQSILDRNFLDAATRFSCLQLLLRKDIRYLETRTFPHSYYKKILHVLLEKGSGLQQLCLKGVWARDQPEFLSSLLNNLKELKVLLIPHIANDLVLRTVFSCTKLVALDISGECTFSPEALSDVKSTTIRVLDLGSYGEKCFGDDEEESYKALANLIENLPNLVILRTYSFTGEALVRLQERNPNYISKLIYVHDTNTTVEKMDAIINICPKLESIHLHTPQTNVLQLMGNLKNLRGLKLSRFKCKELVSYLEEYGDRVETLKLNHCKEETLDLSKICIFCPNLIAIDFFKLQLSCSRFDLFFMNLESIDILYCNIANHVIRYLMTSSPYLRRLVVGDVIRMTDGDIFRLCAECNFSYLEELWFSCARCLTSTAVELLMKHCPNLRSLGQLTGWDLSANDLDYMRAVISTSNTYLTLLPMYVFP